FFLSLSLSLVSLPPSLFLSLPPSLSLSLAFFTSLLRLFYYMGTVLLAYNRMRC
uniref:Ovule protein n=1 Tax=Ascaris lumbricoides TaxID=6252 RepID=A0A0M3ISU1_ASCLU